MSQTVTIAEAILISTAVVLIFAFVKTLLETIEKK